ncbi:hypothetical protein SAMN05216570_2481 [Dyella sp. OK004]|uniref:hypothetical protein n=1 Tax=Dyella sp. OK004 TaxID=1855292 RepID=UPI0008ECBA19|nr:hypothetical protein [Dyella sp. OK004]SFS08927.1 hypothetical protein SAMN05216570_2481 [Dyella sp. OK004]
MATRKRSTASKSPRNKEGAVLAQGDITRLHDQLTNYKIVKQHIQHHTIDELQFYPDHDPRRESPEYTKTHHHLCVELDLPCLVCGVKYSTLGDKKANRYSAKAMETHHHVIEWALQNAVDVDRFNQILRPNLAHRHPNDKTWQYEKPFDAKKITSWVDHSEHNLWVLCDVHHRAKYLGIHEITYPIWVPMDLLRPDFEAWAVEEINKLRAGVSPLQA